MEKMQFKISSALKNLVGKDLITNDYTAVFELVKNSYDAHATKVEIIFSKDKIIIADNGKGMTLDDLKSKWLFLGYSAKKDGTEDQNINKQKSYRDKIRRYYAGAKGIGRFSCDRLGKYLLLTSKSSESQTTEQIAINWTDFEIDQKTEFIHVNVQHTRVKQKISFPLNANNGTILEITGLNDEKIPWNRKRLQDLKRSLEKLINPFSEKNDFSIEIICDRERTRDEEVKKQGGFDRDIVNGIIKNSISTILNLKTTQISVQLHDNKICTVLSDRGVDMYKIQENNKYYTKLSEVKIDLYFLNRSAKMNFTKLMGIEPVNYGSVFLFRNDFRIMPFGNTGDDSWGLDYRAQQGHSRFLGTRDLFGRVDVLTDEIDELKEVSSRDGGLIETETSNQLFKLFETTHRRLERYVAGVLWGEAFLRRDYFATEAEALQKRKELLEIDKDKEQPDYILTSNIGSKIDFIQLIKTLTKDKNIEILYYNTDLANILSSHDIIGAIKPQFINDLEKIAEETNNTDLLISIEGAKRRISELEKDKEAAEYKAYEEEQRRILAEEKARKAEAAKIQAEKREEEASRAKIIAEMQAKEAELKRREEEIKRKEAEYQKKEEEEKRKKVEEAKKQAEIELEKEKKQGIFQRSIIGREKEQILGLQHQINHSSGRIRTNIRHLLSYIAENKIKIDDKIRKYISIISLESTKIESLSKFVTNANFDLKASEITRNIIQFIQEYIQEIYLPEEPTLSTKLNISISKKIETHIMSFRPLEITSLIDNFIQNAEKAGAKNIKFIMQKYENKIQLLIQNDGKMIPEINIPRIFELGFTTTDGSGIGLFNVKSIIERLHGKIDISNNNNHNVTFRIII
jgi:hypothetical protein|nr:ATP-binding protein [uncultured Campylobacter sp.]